MYSVGAFEPCGHDHSMRITGCVYRSRQLSCDTRQARSSRWDHPGRARSSGRQRRNIPTAWLHVQLAFCASATLRTSCDQA